jgi:hypothetical protein
MGEKEEKDLNKERLKAIGESPVYPVETNMVVYYGMSLREHIATQCLTALITARPQEIDTEILSDAAIQYADKLIEKLHTNLDK